MTTSGMEPATCRFVAWCLNHYATARPSGRCVAIFNEHTTTTVRDVILVDWQLTYIRYRSVASVLLVDPLSL